MYTRKSKVWVHQSCCLRNKRMILNIIWLYFLIYQASLFPWFQLYLLSFWGTRHRTGPWHFRQVSHRLMVRCDPRRRPTLLHIHTRQNISYTRRYRPTIHFENLSWNKWYRWWRHIYFSSFWLKGWYIENNVDKMIQSPGWIWIQNRLRFNGVPL